MSRFLVKVLMLLVFLLRFHNEAFSQVFSLTYLKMSSYSNIFNLLFEAVSLAFSLKIFIVIDLYVYTIFFRQRENLHLL